jgi:hypothetical protein
MEVSLKQTIKFVCCVAGVVWDLVAKFCLLYRRLPGFADCSSAAKPVCASEKVPCERSTECESKPEPRAAPPEEK